MDWILIRTLLSLVAVLGLMFAVAWIVRRIGRPAARNGNSGVSIDLMSRRTLQPKASVAVIRVMDRLFLVGATEHSVQLIAEVSAAPDDDLAAGGTDEALHTDGGESSFARNLQKYLTAFRIQAWGSPANGNRKQPGGGL
jgi:flagellar biosynthetic protein FliO